MIPILNILTEQAKTLHIPFNTIAPSLPQGSLKLYLQLSLYKNNIQRASYQ